MKPTIGRVVHYVMADGQVRPMIVTRVFEDGEGDCINGTIFVDGENDLEKMPGGAIPMHVGGTGVPSIPVVYKTSVCFKDPVYDSPDIKNVHAEFAGTWHWPPKVQ